MVMVHAPSAHDAGVDPGDDGNRSAKDVAGGQEEVNYFRPPDQATEKELRCGKTKASCAPQNGALFRTGGNPRPYDLYPAPFHLIGKLTPPTEGENLRAHEADRKSTRLNSSH